LITTIALTLGAVIVACIAIYFLFAGIVISGVGKALTGKSFTPETAVGVIVFTVGLVLLATAYCILPFSFYFTGGIR
jgi:hypothetical protein